MPTVYGQNTSIKKQNVSNVLVNFSCIVNTNNFENYDWILSFGVNNYFSSNHSLLLKTIYCFFHFTVRLEAYFKCISDMSIIALISLYNSFQPLLWKSWIFSPVSLCSPGRSSSCYDNEIVMMNHVYKERFPKVRHAHTHTNTTYTQRLAKSLHDNIIFCLNAHNSKLLEPFRCSVTN